MILQKMEMTVLRRVNKLNRNSKDQAFQTVHEGAFWANFVRISTIKQNIDIFGNFLGKLDQIPEDFCYYLKYLVSKFRILVHKRTILAWKLIFCSTLSTFRPKCPKTNGYNQTKNKLSLIIYFGNPKFWKCLGYNYDWLSIPPLDENLLFRTFVQWV